eukprot:Tbor_TRINITY_DN1964_c0_g1::TRINITY_DN1964_c0_g1_i1::g.3519::m.3519
MKSTLVRLHGKLTFPIGTGRGMHMGSELISMDPSNHIYHDPAKLRMQLDLDGYLYFKNIIPRPVVAKAFDEVGRQMLDNEWTTMEAREKQAEKNGFAIGIPFPQEYSSQPLTGVRLPVPTSGFEMKEAIKQALCGANVMAAVRQVFGGGTEVLPHYQLEMSPPGESHGFQSSSIFTSRGTRLLLCAWVPLHDITLTTGPLAIVRGSNSSSSYKVIREKYGDYDIEAGDVYGDGCLTHDASELLPLGKVKVRDHEGKLVEEDDNPIVSTSFESGDMVLTTVYTLFSYLTNTSDKWRVSGSTYWMMDGDNIGPDPRYTLVKDGDSDTDGMQQWLNNRNDKGKYPKSMAQKRTEWGLSTLHKPEGVSSSSEKM